MKRKWLRTSLLCLVLFVVACFGIFAWSASRPIPVIGGVLPKEEQNRIRQIVKHEMWKHEFPDSSWKTISRCPRALCELAAARLGLIEILRPNMIEVAVRSHFGIYYFRLWKREGAWLVQSREKLPARPPPRLGDLPKTGPEFFGSLSNQVKVSFQ